MIAASMVEARMAVRNREFMLIKAQLKEENKRFRNNKFMRSRAGYVLPGSSKKDIERAVRLRKLMAKDKSIKAPPSPTMEIRPLTPEGGINVGFTQPTVAPRKGFPLKPNIYNNVLDITVESTRDGSNFKGDFTQSKKMRQLSQANDDDDDAA